MDASEGGIRVFFTDLICDVLAEHGPSISGQYEIGAGVSITCSWALKTDQADFKKRAREITLSVSQSALEDFVSADGEQLDDMRSRVIRRMKSRMKAYTPDYEDSNAEPLVIAFDRVRH